MVSRSRTSNAVLVERRSLSRPTERDRERRRETERERYVQVARVHDQADERRDIHKGHDDVLAVEEPTGAVVQHKAGHAEDVHAEELAGQGGHARRLVEGEQDGLSIPPAMVVVVVEVEVEVDVDVIVDVEEAV